MLNISIPTIVFQIINFVILAVALYFLLFRTVRKTIKKHADEKAQIMKDIENNQAESQKVLEEYNARLAQVSKEVNEVVESARQKLETEHQAILADLEAEIGEKIAKADDEVARRQEVVTEQYFARLLDQVIETSRTVIMKSIPLDPHKLLVQQMADEIWRLGREDLQQVATIRASFKERTPPVYVETAAPLSTEQQGLLIRTFSALADRNIKLEIRENKLLGAGCRVRIADLVVDNSIDSHLQKLKQTAAEDLRSRLMHEPLK